MTVTPFLNPAANTLSQSTASPIPCELVRGTDHRFLAEWMPRVRRESVALNLSAVERIDAAGIAVLIALYRTAAESGREFLVVDPSPRVLELLRLVGLASILIPSLKAGNTPAASLPCACPAA